jgi:hypothetical protein
MNRRERRAKAREERAALEKERELAVRAASDASDAGGRGDDAEEYPVSPSAANHVTGKMIRASRSVWPVEEIHERLAVETTARNLESDDGRVSNGAVKNLIAMQSQILRRDEIERGVGAGASSAVNIANIQNNGPTVIQLVPQVVTTHAEAVAVLSEATGLPPE